jgi:formate hydrogenlyase transcriptional activator
VIATAEDRYRLLLQVAEAVNSQLDLGGLLEELANVLVPLVDLDGMGIVTVSGDRLRPHAIFVKGVEPRSGESARARIARALDLTAEEYEARYGGPMPAAGSGTEQVARLGRADACDDLAAAATGFEEDERLRTFGVRSYVRAPLVFRDRLVGSLTFARLSPRPFGADERLLLEEISRPIAGAVSNALAYEEIARLKNRLQEENLVLRQEIDEQAMFEEIVGASTPLRKLLAEVEKVAPTGSTVLVTGETGTGKELIARAIHRRSPRAARPMIKVNLASLPDTLMASELFGHERGAFTGALQRRAGRFELANGGTIFLDEIGELPADVQVALLRVLQEDEFERVGGNQTIRTDARVIAATNRDLARAIDEGRFRSDLFYRLNVFPLAVPPLRDRREDIPILVEYFAARHGARLGRHFDSVDRRTLALLMDYSWPGNIRELENVIERASILAEGRTLRVDEGMLHAGVASRGLPPASAPTAPEVVHTRRAPSLRDEETRAIEEALAATRGRVAGVSGAASRLGVPATTLESKIKRLGIDKFRVRRG